MIGRPKVQFSGGPCWDAVAAGPPVHSHRQSFTHVVVCPVGSCSKERIDGSRGSLTSMT